MLSGHHAPSGAFVSFRPASVLPHSILVGALLASCATAAPAAPQPLRLATTTSTYDSGLLDAILPIFEADYNVDVDVIAVGTGQAIEIGKSGDADVLLVHNRAQEEAFVSEGYGIERVPVMFNDFVLVGPLDDPAGIASAGSAAEALHRIFDRRTTFVSRGDDSGTHAKEQELWEAAGLKPGPSDFWHLSIGQGMGETLQFVSEERAYTLSDRGTYLSLAPVLPDLAILFGGPTLAENPDPAMRNAYSVIQVKAREAQAPAARTAQALVRWLTSIETQELIRNYGVERYGQPLFCPSSKEWCEANGPAASGCS